MEERLPNLSHLSFCILHITSLWQCPMYHKILHPVQPFLRLGWLWCFSSSLGTSLWVWFCHWEWHGWWVSRKNSGMVKQNPSEGLLGSKHYPTHCSAGLLPFPAHCPIPLCSHLGYSDFTIGSMTFWNCLFIPNIFSVSLEYFLMYDL